MEKLYKVLIGVAFLFSLASCDSFLEEENLSGSDSNNYFGSQESLEQLVASAYMDLRSAYRNYAIEQIGTDIFQFSTFSFYSYHEFSVYQGEIKEAWTSYYQAIHSCNTIITRASDIDTSVEIKEQSVAEAKTLRSLMYFKLVQLFGDVPLLLDEVKTDKVNYIREDEELVYQQIIKDLEESINMLPIEQNLQGKVTKGMAQHLLAKIYLTRGYKPYGDSSDFAVAANLADAVITSGQYQLLDTYAEVFDIDNQVNTEVIFSVQYSSQLNANNVNNDIAGNNKHQICKLSLDGDGYARIPSFYARPAGLTNPSAFLFTLYDEFDAEDTRNEVSYNYTLYAIVDGENISEGDIMMHFARNDWTAQEKDQVSYRVYNPDEYDDFIFPPFKKFDEFLPYGDNEGTRDTYVFRLAETYLIGAEALLMNNNLNKAVEYVNIIRRRAAESDEDKSNMEITADQLTIDFILDESARELAGETERWCDLKRTGKLIERARAHNYWVTYYNEMNENHLVRPIPQSEVDLSGGSLIQNPGYKG